MSKPLTMTEQRKADIEHAIDHPSQADMDGTMHSNACALWDEMDALRAALAAAEAKLATFGMVELAVRNPNVSSYITEWEGRALRAEVALADERRHVVDLVLALEETRCTCEAVFIGGRPIALKCVKCRTLEAHAARRAAEEAEAAGVTPMSPDGMGRAE